VADRSKYELRRNYFSYRIVPIHGIVCLVVYLLSLSIVSDYDYINFGLWMTL